jgi:hypothetical protein
VRNLLLKYIRQALPGSLFRQTKRRGVECHLENDPGKKICSPSLFFLSLFLSAAAVTFSTMTSTPQGIDVVGVDSGLNGRHCENHTVCGHFVKANDYLYCKWAVQKFDLGEIESCVQVHKLAADGHISCHVGYLPRRLVRASRDKADGEKDGGKSYDGLWLKVAQDLRLSDNSAERARSHRNYGIVYCHVAKDDWLFRKNPFEVAINIPKTVLETSSELPLAPEKSNEDDDDDDPDKEDSSS